MSWMEVIGAYLGAEKQAEGAADAADAKAKGIVQGIDAMRDARDQGIQRVQSALPISEQNILRGQQAAASLLSGTMPTQLRMAREGAVAAQQNLLAGMPQVQNAILGKPIDMSGFQVYQGAAIPEMDFSMPEFDTYSSVLGGVGQTEQPAQQPEVIEQQTIDALAQQGWLIDAEGGMAGETRPGSFNMGGHTITDATGQGRTAQDFSVDFSSIMDGLTEMAGNVIENTGGRYSNAFGAGTLVGGLPGGVLATIGTAVYDYFTGDDVDTNEDGSGFDMDHTGSPDFSSIQNTNAYGSPFDAQPSSHPVNEYTTNWNGTLGSGGREGGRAGQADGTESPGSPGSVGHGGGIGL